jgi:hypothetical protein
MYRDICDQICGFGRRSAGIAHWANQKPLAIIYHHGCVIHRKYPAVVRPRFDSLEIGESIDVVFDLAGRDALILARTLRFFFFNC